MKKKWLLIAMVWVISLSTAATAAISVTTAYGNGADTFVGNDSNKGPDNNYGTGGTMDVRNYVGVRAHIAYVRFDISDISANKAGAQLQIYITQGGAARTWNVYGLTDNDLDDAWAEMSITYNTAPGMLAATEGNYTIDETKLTLLGTIAVPTTANVAVTSDTIALPLESFLADDTNGRVTFVLIPTGADRQFYVAAKEGLTGNPTWSAPTLIFPNANRCARSAVPAMGASVMPSLSTLSWTNTEPNNISGIISCNVYLGTSEPNILLPGYGLTQIASGITANSATIPAGMTPLADATYYWIVDTYDSSTTPNFLGTGAIWQFHSTLMPIIMTHPVAQTVPLGQTAQFSVSVQSYTTPHYTWYHSNDNVNNTAADDTVIGSDSAALSFTTARTDDGFFYCKIVNDSGEANAVRSNTARLVVERQVAHWTMDAADFVGGLYQDVSGEAHHADPNGTPSFEAGVTAADGAVIMGSAAHADAGTWYPSSHSGEFTIAAWIKWNGENGGFQNILSKMDTWAEAEMMWEFGISSGGTLILAVDHGDTGDQYVRNGTPPTGEWEFVAATFAGTSGTVYRAIDGNVSFTSVSETVALGTNTAAPLRLGGNAGSELFNGSMDDVQVFNYALTPVQMADLYNLMLSRDFCVLTFGSTQFDLDLNDNCRVELGDFATFAAKWMECGIYPATACP